MQEAPHAGNSCLWRCTPREAGKSCWRTSNSTWTCFTDRACGSAAWRAATSASSTACARAPRVSSILRRGRYRLRAASGPTSVHAASTMAAAARLIPTCRKVHRTRLAGPQTKKHNVQTAQRQYPERSRTWEMSVPPSSQCANAEPKRAGFPARLQNAWRPASQTSGASAAGTAVAASSTSAWSCSAASGLLLGEGPESSLESPSRRRWPV